MRPPVTPHRPLHPPVEAQRRPGIRRLLAVVGLLAAASLTATACGGADDGADGAATTTAPSAETVASEPATGSASTTSGDAAGATTSTVSEAPAAAASSTVPPASTVVAVAGLSEEEVAALVWMREEEKLALDVYTALGALWGVPIFDNIAASERTHTDAVRELLDAYGIADPAATAPSGVFTDPALQQLYDELLAKGSTSLTDALTVGATIEDLDIVDLQERATDTADIAAVYSELEKGSRNHLRAFVSQLEAQDGSYRPQYLSLDAYTAIVTSETERGPAGR